jgi:Transposase IS4
MANRKRKYKLAEVVRLFTCSSDSEDLDEVCRSEQELETEEEIEQGEGIDDSDNNSDVQVPSTSRKQNRRHVAVLADTDSEDDLPAPVQRPHARRTRVTAATLDDWTKDISLFDSNDALFKPNENAGLKNIPAFIDANSGPCDFLGLFWSDDLWKLLVTETNRQAACVAADKPGNYYSKSFEDVTVTEMKAFFGCRIAMEMLIHKDRY